MACYAACGRLIKRESIFIGIGELFQQRGRHCAGALTPIAALAAWLRGPTLVDQAAQQSPAGETG